MRAHRRWWGRTALAVLGTACLGSVAFGGCGGEPPKGEPAETSTGGQGDGGQGGDPGGSRGGQEPNPTPPLIDRVDTGTKVDKVDLLFVIDNSVSMGDKQAILEEAVPSLVRRLVDPGCVEQDSGEVTPLEGAACPPGYRREFAPLDDIHIGVVTSSLGGHGGPNNVCAAPSIALPHTNDRGELLPNVRSGLPADDPAGFLHWRGTGSDEVEAFVGKFTSHVVGVAETGCGYEAPLESWYRFLVDPDPPIDMMLGQGNVAIPTATNDALLAQRAAFLRPDSLLAIIMLSDEDDCSIRDGGTDWLAADHTRRLWAATSVCDTNPNDPCCHSCRVSPPDGCGIDEVCGDSPMDAPTLPASEDAHNNRCEEQKRRFGLDFLYSPQRYVDALTKPHVPNRAGELVPNPLFAWSGEVAPRDPSRVFLAGIIGVPWQDIATEGSLEPGSETLVFLSAEELEAQGRWEVILGDPTASPPVRPTDPLMQVSLGPPRSGTNPITGDEIALAGSATLGNPINGHDYHPDGDRQFACIFRLPEPLTPAVCNEKPDGACDCSVAGAEATQNPLCFDTSESTFSTTQYWAKAYPGPRFLRVLRGFGDNAIVASICPKNLQLETSNPNYGYNPAMGAIVKRLSEVLAGRCLSQELEVDDEGQVPCAVVEVLAASAADPRGCERPGRSDVSEEVAEAVRERVLQSELCQEGCGALAMCAIDALRGEDRDACLFERSGADFVPGYCYIDPALGPDVAGGMNCSADEPEECTNPLVDVCAEGERRLLRFVGGDVEPTPAPGSVTFVVCDADAGVRADRRDF